MKNAFKIIGIAMAIVGMLVVSACSGTSGQVKADVPNTFVLLSSEEHDGVEFDIFYDSQTDVEWIVTSGISNRNYSTSVRVDANGKPVLYKK